jgi:hypothetical protein
MKNSTAAGVAILLAIPALFSLHRSSQQAGRDAERVRIAEEQEEIAVAFARQQTANLQRERAKTIQVERDLYRERINSLRSLQSSDSTVAAARQVVEDSASTVGTLRQHLRAAIADNETLAFQFRAYLAKDDSVHYAWGVEREASNKAMIANMAVLEAKDRVIASLKAQECKVLWFKCPTRTNVAVVTALVTAGVLTLARD